jgi:hypothetical protein
MSKSQNVVLSVVSAEQVQGVRRTDGAFTATYFPYWNQESRVQDSSQLLFCVVEVPIRWRKPRLARKTGGLTTDN